jgi:cation diffusion facilitator CzcD-associated flavoprotein CzcO
MEVWREHMPKGMLLKSDGFASNLSDPALELTLGKFCNDRGIPYDDTHIPVAIETFIDYAIDFQKQRVPQLDTRRVVRIERDAEHYSVELEGGETVFARRVVIAVGVSHFAYVPPILAGLPAHLASHSSSHGDPSAYRGKKVIIIGAGASAIDLAALMYECGVDVTVAARSPAIEFHIPPRPGPRSFWQRVRNPSTGLGPGWKSRFYTAVPGAFRYFPKERRLRIVRRHLGPAPGWPMRKRIEGKVPIHLGQSIAAAQPQNGGVRLSFAAKDGSIAEQESEHVVAATGYRPDLERLTFLGQSIRGGVRTFAKAPVLSPDFQSSVPGLYFVGIASVYDFGPIMRFAYGADFTARRLARHLSREAQR